MPYYFEVVLSGGSYTNVLVMANDVADASSKVEDLYRREGVCLDEVSVVRITRTKITKVIE